MFKKILLHTFIGIFIASIISALYVFIPVQLKEFDSKIRDMMFVQRGDVPTKNKVVIVDIDEKSLKELGQWPWPRDKFAQVLVNLSNAEVSAIGLDIVFSEPDNASPHKIIQELGLENIPEDKMVNNDEVLAYYVANTPTILGYVFELDASEYEGLEGPSIPAAFIQKGRGETESLIEAKGVLKNLAIIQDNSYSSGFFNNIPDPSGVIRSVPLAIAYDMEVFPSLALELVRASKQIGKITINYDGNLGVNSVEIGDKIIPTDRHGRIFLNYRGDKASFPYIPIKDIYNNTFDKEFFKDKIVLIGTSAVGLMDLRTTPFNNVYPGVEVHANVVDNILSDDFISTPFWADGANLVSIFTIAIILSLILAFSNAIFTLVSITIFGIGILYFNYYMLFDEGLILNIFFPLLTILVVVINSTIVNYFLETRQKNMIKGKFATKVSPAVMEDLINNPNGDAFAAMEKEITVFFSDVRNFTNISEAMGDAKNLIEFMNEYMDPMTDIIIETGGTVDKFIGDAIMAYWNAPANVEDHADKALIATLNQLHGVVELNKKLRVDPRFKPVVDMSDRLGLPIVDIGIGLNTGMAIVGEMGSSARADYTCIGDPVNLGARLESLCKYYNSKCNISNFTKEQLKGDYIFRFLDLVTVKGKSEPIEIWQVHDYENGKDGNYLFDCTRQRLQEELDFYHKAIELYKAAKFEEALKIFKDINSWEDKANKNVYDMYIERCEHYIEEPPVDFNGVFKHTTKG
jgi:adenylate cyclase